MEKFEAAVNVVQNLPKGGEYEPSAAVKLKFYSLYKQATIGPCTTTRPGFWDMVGKYKWEAWNELGNMSKDEAMSEYVQQLKSMIETMPHSEEVNNFLHIWGPFYELVNDQAETIAYFPEADGVVQSHSSGNNDNSEFVTVDSQGDAVSMELSNLGNPLRATGYDGLPSPVTSPASSIYEDSMTEFVVPPLRGPATPRSQTATTSTPARPVEGAAFTDPPLESAAFTDPPLEGAAFTNPPLEGARLLPETAVSIPPDDPPGLPAPNLRADLDSLEGRVSSLERLLDSWRSGRPDSRTDGRAGSWVTGLWSGGRDWLLMTAGILLGATLVLLRTRRIIIGPNRRSD